MESRRIGRYLPLMAVIAAGLLAVGCSGDNGGTDPVGGSGGSGGTGGTGGSGGAGTCPDGNQDPGEDCDDGNTVDNDCCSNTCQIVNPTCGNSAIECGEDCDNGDTVGGDGCSAICKHEICGNGYPDVGEECDDGNTTSGDGCSATCDVECLRDQECNGDAMEICVIAEGQQFGSCVAQGGGCNVDQNCGSVATEHCGSGNCYCAKNTNDDPFYGVCWHRLDFCATGCETDAECGNSNVFTRPAECVTYHVQGEGDTKVCLPTVIASQTCPPGYVMGGPDDGGLDMTGYCVPQQLFCPNTPCTSDVECKDPAFPVCDLARQICIKGCFINWQQDLETVGCSPGKPACHAMPERYNPDLLNDCATAGTFGTGKCGIECETDVDCAHRGNDVHGNPYVCKNDGGINRCRPAGCVDDMECPEPGSGSEYLGYCDPYQQACTWNNCRMGVDPRNGCGVNDPYLDCNTTHKCVEDEGQPEGYGVCVLKNCIDNGGAMLDCKGGQFCAGEPMISMMTGEEEGEPLPVPDDVPIGVCYDMDTPVWCGTTSCTPGDNSGCRADNLPGRHDDNPGYCFPTQEGAQCYFGCKYTAECPALWSCDSSNLQVRSTLPDAGLKICESDFDCGTGNHCVEPKVSGAVWTGWSSYTDPDTGEVYNQLPFKVCSCKDTGACGGDAVCNEGIATRNPDQPDVEVDRYCSTGSDALCGPGGTLEWWGTSSMDDSFNFFPIFNCSCGPGSDSTCPAIGPTGTIMQDSPTRCGQNMRDRYLCVGGQVCIPKIFNDPATGEQYCGVRRE